MIYFISRSSFRKNSQSTASDDYSSNDQNASKRVKNSSSTTPLKNATNATRISQERLLTSRSASDVTEISLPFSTMPQKVVIPSKRDPISPTTSFDHELGELERQLTNTRKSIDAKFYKSLANSSSPFFRPSKPPGLMSPEETSQSENELIRRSEDSADENTSDLTTGHNTAAIFDNDFSVSMNPDESVIRMPKTEPLRYHDDDPGDPPKVPKRRESLDVSLESTKREESTVYITPASPSKTPRQVLRNAEPITFEIDAKGGHVKKLDTASVFSDEKISSKAPDHERSESSASDFTVEVRMKSGSRETLIDSDSSRKGNLVRTKVRDASDIIYERSKGRESPVNTHREIKVRASVDHTASMEPNNEHSKLTQKHSHDARLETSSPALEHEEKPPKVKTHPSPKLHARENIVKALGGIASRSNKAFKSPSVDKKGKPGVILDDSLTDTFAKLDAAFGFKGTPTSPPDNGQCDDKRKRRRNHKRRSRIYEPPTSDSDDDDSSPTGSSRRRSGIRIQLKKNDDPETASLNSKSEAEQSLEAAISDFHISLSSMPERKASHKRTYSTPYYPPYNSDNNDANAPRVLNRSRPSSHRNSYGREQRSKSQDFTPPSRRPLSDYSGSSSKNSDRERESSTKKRSEAKISLTSLKPWSPPLRRVEPSSSIMQHVKENSTSQKRGHVTKPKCLTIDTKACANSKDEVIEYEEQIITETIAVEDQLSPLPGGPSPRPIKFNSSRYTNSLPGRSHKRRKAAAQKNAEETGLRSKSSKFVI